MRLGVVVGLLLVACAEGGARPKPGDTNASFGGQPSVGEVQLPFVVDDHFTPTGEMGDAIGSLVSDPNSCLARPEGAQGACYAFRLETGGAVGWSGLYWLAAPNQWGTGKGVMIESGAKKLRFFAASSEPTVVTFLVGGVAGEVPYPDGFALKLEVELKATLTEYEIALDQANYAGGVQGGFGFTAAPAASLTIYLDNLRWQ